jgi:hypothetical protein
MNLQIEQGCVHLSRHGHFGLLDARGAKLTCVSGALWITQDNDIRDIVLTPGEHFELDRDGLAIVQATDNASVRVRLAA